MDTLLSTRQVHHESLHFPGLDGLRGIAAFIVVLLHGTLFIKNSGYIPPAACLSVDFFFLLSGLVIARAYDRRLMDRMSCRQFMTIRLIRLYPMLFIGTALGGTLFVLGQTTNNHNTDLMMIFLIISGSFSLLPIGLLFGFTGYPANVAAWSLFFEIFINATYGSSVNKLNNRSITVLVVLSGLALIPMAIWGGRYIDVGFGDPTAFFLGFIRVTYPFWAGVLMFRHGFATPAVPIVIIGVVLALLLLAPIDSPVYNLLLTLFVFPVIVAFATCANIGRKIAAICRAFGELSYPLYLVHVPVYRAINQIEQKTHFSVSPWLLVLIGFILSVILGEILRIGFDEPVRRWLSLRHRDHKLAMRGG